ncbi:unnamed protein product, partial [Pylaiella littoralis]
VNTLQTVTHFVGAVLIANFISEEWDYRSLWRAGGSWGSAISLRRSWKWASSSPYFTSSLLC